MKVKAVVARTAGTWLLAMRGQHSRPALRGYTHATGGRPRDVHHYAYSAPCHPLHDAAPVHEALYATGSDGMHGREGERNNAQNDYVTPTPPQ